MKDYLAVARQIVERRRSGMSAQKAQEAQEARPLNALHTLIAHANGPQTGTAEAASNHESEDLIELFHERAAIREFDGRRPRSLAERLAYGEVIETWCRRHPQQLAPGICAGCGRPLAGDRLELPDGAQVHFADCQFACLIRYGDARKRRAVVALSTLGLVPPLDWDA